MRSIVQSRLRCWLLPLGALVAGVAIVGCAAWPAPAVSRAAASPSPAAGGAEEPAEANPVAWARYRVTQFGPYPLQFTYTRDADGYWLVRESVQDAGLVPLGKDPLTSEEFDAEVWAPARLARRAYVPADPPDGLPTDRWGPISCWAAPEGTETFCANADGVIVAVSLRRDRLPGGPRDANQLRTLDDWQPLAP